MGGGGEEDSTVGTHGVASILESMGLGPGGGGMKPGLKNRGGGDRVTTLDGYLSKAAGSGGGGGGPADPKPPPLDEKLEKIRQRREERRLHLRLTMVMTGLVGIIFAALQLSSGARRDREVLNSIRAARGRRYSLRAGAGDGQGFNEYEEFGEGVDRPVPGGANLGRFGGGHRTPSDVALKLARVPREEGGPRRDFDRLSELGGYRGAKRYYGEEDLQDRDQDRDWEQDHEWDGDLADPIEIGGDDAAGMIDDRDQDREREVRPPKEEDWEEENSRRKDVLPPGAMGESDADGGRAEKAAMREKSALPPISPKGGKGPDATQAEIDAVVREYAPYTFKYLSELTPNMNVGGRKGIPLFWHIPRSGGSIPNRVMTQCLGLTLASEAGGAEGHGDDAELRVVSIGGFKYVNVNVNTEEGLDRAARLGLASSGLADVVATPLLGKAIVALLGDTSGEGGDSDRRQASAFAMFRDPVERAISTYHNLKMGGHPQVSDMTVEEYAKSPFAENNWMVRFLTGKMDGEVTENHLAAAREVLRTRFVVGLLSNKAESMERFEHYFGWTHKGKSGWDCWEREIRGDPSVNESAKYFIKEGNQAWNLLQWQNKLDVKLYAYAHYLFGRQGGELFPDLVHTNDK